MRARLSPRCCLLLSCLLVGKVNAITQLSTGDLLALKRMEKYAVLQSSSHLKMVWVERKIMSLTNSPFLCNLLYAFENERELFLIMPFMQGGDLRFHLKERGTMPVSTCLFYACELILGLQALHKANVVFRDLKPDNILVRRNRCRETTTPAVPATTSCEQRTSPVVRSNPFRRCSCSLLSCVLASVLCLPHSFAARRCGPSAHFGFRIGVHPRGAKQLADHWTSWNSRVRIALRSHSLIGRGCAGVAVLNTLSHFDCV